MLLKTGWRSRKCEIKNDILRIEVKVFGQNFKSAMGYLSYFALFGVCLNPFIKSHNNHGCAKTLQMMAVR